MSPRRRPLPRYDRVMLAMSVVALLASLTLASTVNVGLGGLMLGCFLMLWIIGDQIRQSR